MSTLSQAIDHILQEESQTTASLVPGTLKLGMKEELWDQRYYVRHRLELVRRIWAIADANALALMPMLGEDYEAARMWAKYLAEEMSYDKLHITELERHGIDEARVRATPPLPSTVAMVQTIVRNIHAVGSLPAVAYAVFVERSSVRAPATPGDKTREAFGAPFFEGAATHAGVDEEHSRQVVEIAHRLIQRRPDGGALFFSLVRQTAAFFRTYLAELQPFAMSMPSPMMQWPGAVPDRPSEQHLD